MLSIIIREECEEAEMEALALACQSQIRDDRLDRETG
jgi:hypothetical protein